MQRLDDVALPDGSELYDCIPVDWLWLPKWMRLTLGYLTASVFSSLFYVGPGLIFAAAAALVWRNWTLALAFAAPVVLSFVLPLKEWPWARKLPQLWYEVFSIRHNVPPHMQEMMIQLGTPPVTKDGQTKPPREQYILSMHPHGIIPLQALIWAAYCDQYFTGLYGFGAVASVVQWIPILNSLLGWFTCVPADYATLRDGLIHGVCKPANRVGRKPTNLFVLGGGVAEVFASQPNTHVMIYKNRRGLPRLALETGASLVPMWVFGGTDFFAQLATSSGWMSKFSRFMRAGLTVYWGRFGLPIPFIPPHGVTLVIGAPIRVEKLGPNPPKDRVDALHAQYIDAVRALFDKYKAEAGYPTATLNVQ